MRLRVEVTAEDISAGIPEDSCECPVARALKRAGVVEEFAFDGHGFPDPWASPRLEFDDIYDEGDRLVVRMPIEAGRFAERFDARQPVEPFTFEIDVPDAAVRP